MLQLQTAFGYSLQPTFGLFESHYSVIYKCKHFISTNAFLTTPFGMQCAIKQVYLSTKKLIKAVNGESF